jgi:hypothetical protein
MTEQYLVLPTEEFLVDLKRNVQYRNKMTNFKAPLQGKLLKEAQKMLAEISQKLELFPEGYADVTNIYKRKRTTRRLIYINTSILFTVERHSVILLAMIPNKLDSQQLDRYRLLVDNYIDVILHPLKDPLNFNGDTVYFDSKTGELLGATRRHKSDVELINSRVVTSDSSLFLTLVGTIANQRVTFSIEKETLQTRKLNMSDANNPQLLKKFIDNI